MIRTVLFLFFSVTLLGDSSDSLKAIDQARLQLKTMGKVDLIALNASGLTFVDSSKDVEDLMKVLLSRKEDGQIKKMAADAMSKFRSKDSSDAMGVSLKVTEIITNLHFRSFWPRELFQKMMFCGRI